MKFRTTAKQIAAGIIAAAMLIGTLAGCGASRPSDADRASWQSWATDIVASAPDAAACR